MRHSKTNMPSPAVFGDCIAFNLRRVTRVVTRHFSSELRAVGVTPTQIPILARLGGGDALTMAEMTDWLGMDRTTLLRNLRPLEREGLIRQRIPAARRQVEVSITPEGRRKLAEIYPHWKRAQDAVRQTLGAHRWDAILGDLETAAEKFG